HGTPILNNLGRAPDVPTSRNYIGLQTKRLSSCDGPVLPAFSDPHPAVANLSGPVVPAPQQFAHELRHISLASLVRPISSRPPNPKIHPRLPPIHLCRGARHRSWAHTIGSP